MHEKVKAYLEMQRKHVNTNERLYRARILVAANLYETYHGPHVEELFEPIIPKRTIKKTEAIQYVIEKATGNVLAIRYDLKEKVFIVMTPIKVTDEEFEEIEKYNKPKPLLINPLVLSVCAYILYILGIGFFMGAVIYESFNWGYIISAISFMNGLIINVLSMLVKNLKT